MIKPSNKKWPVKLDKNLLAMNWRNSTAHKLSLLLLGSLREEEDAPCTLSLDDEPVESRLSVINALHKPHVYAGSEVDNPVDVLATELISKFIYLDAPLENEPFLLTSSVLDGQKSFLFFVEGLANYMLDNDPRGLGVMQHAKNTLNSLHLRGPDTSYLKGMTRFVLFSKPGPHLMKSRQFTSWTLYPPGDPGYNKVMQGMYEVWKRHNSRARKCYVYTLHTDSVTPNEVVVDTQDFINRADAQVKKYADPDLKAAYHTLRGHIAKKLWEKEVILVGNNHHTHVTDDELYKII